MSLWKDTFKINQIKHESRKNGKHHLFIRVFDSPDQKNKRKNYLLRKSSDSTEQKRLFCVACNRWAKVQICKIVASRECNSEWRKKCRQFWRQFDNHC